MPRDGWSATELQMIAGSSCWAKADDTYVRPPARDPRRLRGLSRFFQRIRRAVEALLSD